MCDAVAQITSGTTAASRATTRFCVKILEDWYFDKHGEPFTLSACRDEKRLNDVLFTAVQEVIAFDDSSILR